MQFILGLGLHIVVAVFFAIHALRTGRPMYWLIILFSFPLLGSIAYFFAEFMPANKLDHGVQKASKTALKLLDPSRKLRDAQKAFELTPTIQNRIRLASALDEAGQYNAAATEFDACLNGPFANDLEVCFLAANAKLHNNQSTEAITLLTKIRQKQANFRPEQLSLLLAKAYVAARNNTQARQEFSYALDTFGSTDCMIDYAIWAISVGDIATAKNLHVSLDKNWQHWNKNTRAIYKSKLNEINAGISGKK